MNMNNIMAQAQKMQKGIQKKQEEIISKQITEEDIKTHENKLLIINK